MEPTSIASRRIYTLLLLVSIGALAGLFYSMVPSIPENAVLKEGHMPPLVPGEVGEGWQRFFQRAVMFAKAPKSPDEAAASRQIDKGAWLTASTSQNRLFRELRLKLLQLWLMWPKRGCYLARVTWEKPLGRPLRAIWRALSLSRTVIVWQLQGPQPKQGHEMLVELRGRLRKLLTACPMPRADLLVWLRALRRLDQLQDYVAAVPAVAAGQRKSQVRIAQWWAHHQPMIRKALQWDHRALNAAFEKWLAKGSKWWRSYWVDVRKTRALHIRWLRLMMRRASMQKPYTSPWTLSPLESLLQRTSARSSWVAFFEKNAIGMELLAQALPLHRGRALLASWHKHRCLIASHAKRWGPLPKRGDLALPTENPFTGKALITRTGAQVCGVPAPFGLGLSPSLRAAVPLPSPPTKR